MRFIITLIVIIILGIVSYFVLGPRFDVQEVNHLGDRLAPAERSEPSSIPNEGESTKLQNPKTYTSPGERFQHQYPSDWNIHTTISDGEGRGAYGPILSSWILQSFKSPEAGSGGIPENSAKADFEISQNEQNVRAREIAECNMKTVECSNQTINGIEYTVSRTVLNTGMVSIIAATVQDDTIYVARFLAAEGTEQEQRIKTINSIIQTFEVL